MFFQEWSALLQLLMERIRFSNSSDSVEKTFLQLLANFAYHDLYFTCTFGRDELLFGNCFA